MEHGLTPLFTGRYLFPANLRTKAGGVFIDPKVPTNGV